MEKLTYIAEGDALPRSVKEYLLSLGFSVTLIKSVKYGGILLNGSRVNTNATVRCGDEICILMPDEASENIEPMNIPLKVVYEDEYLLAVDKPTNMPTHPSKGNNLPTLANAVMGMYGGNFVFRAITRLDRDTSGLVLIAKDRISAYRLSEDMKSGKIKKEYRALVRGVPNTKEGSIDAPIRRVAEGDIRRGVFADGKSALTDYRVVEIIGDNALCEINLHTGRTHQIRVHMAHIGHPLIGDFLYGSRDDGDYHLRCFRLSFLHPKSRERIVLEI